MVAGTEKGSVSMDMDKTESVDPSTEAAEEAIDQAPEGLIDIDAIKAKFEIPAELKTAYDKVVLAGLRIMFDKGSHKEMFLSQLDKEGPMAQKISDGVVALIYMLWQESNQTIPPPIISPLTVCFTLEAFDFLQKSGEPEATKEVLGEALNLAHDTVMQKFGATEHLARMEQKASTQPPAGQPAEQPQPGMMDGGMQ